MQLKKVLGALTVIAVAAALAPASSSAETERPAFRTYVACGEAAEARPARNCPRNAQKGAFFRSNLRPVHYSVCVTFPTRRRPLCAKRQRAAEGELYVNKITSKLRGIHRVTWFVGGKRVGIFRFRITRPHTPPASGRGTRLPAR